jgi:hypothetical protein
MLLEGRLELLVLCGLRHLRQRAQDIFWPNEIVAGTVTDIRLAALSHARALLLDDYRAFDDVTDSRR